MAPNETPKTWEELRYHILQQLDKIDRLEQEMGAMRLELGVVKSKLTIIVSAASSIVAIVVTLITNYVGGKQ